LSQDARLETLEIKVAHLERALQELSDVLFQQQRLLDALNVRHASLLERLEGAGGATGPDSHFEIPPHY
jgi:SlyX protein